MVAASPQRNGARPPPIILVRTESGSIMPAIKWNGHEAYSLRDRLENRVFGKVESAALREAFRIVRHNGSLDISGEYGSIEIDSGEFEADSILQEEMDRKYESVSSKGDLRSKERFKRLHR